MHFLDWFGHSSFLIRGKSRIYIDPWNLPDWNLPRADLVLITHDHADHCSLADVRRIAKLDTIVVGPRSCLKRFMLNQVPISPGETREVLGNSIQSVPAYNPEDGRPHPGSNQWMGFIVPAGGSRIYHAGDTGLIPEFEGLKADLAFLPVSGGDTMNAEEAARGAKKIGARVSFPIHYNDSADSRAEAEKFVRLCFAANVPAKLLQRTEMPALS